MQRRFVGTGAMGTPLGFFCNRDNESLGHDVPDRFVGPVGLEPTTRGLKVRCSAS
jgi:hypothetical protein